MVTMPSSFATSDMVMSWSGFFSMRPRAAAITLLRFSELGRPRLRRGASVLLSVDFMEFHLVKQKRMPDIVTHLMNVVLADDDLVNRPDPRCAAIPCFRAQTVPPW